MTPKRKRLTFVGLGALLLATAAALILTAMEDTLVFFHSPSEILEKPMAPDRRIRIGGLVEEGSVEKTGHTVKFRITDLAATIPVVYSGILPDLFREGQGVVAEGTFRGGTFTADEVLAKHDENYMPPEVADALKKSGQWNHMKESMEKAGQISGGKAE